MRILLIMIQLLFTTVFISIANARYDSECADCEDLTWSCEFGPHGCIRKGEKCRSDCCQSILSWFTNCNKCKGECRDAEEQCVSECRAVVDQCHSLCDVTCCEKQNKCFTKGKAFSDIAWRFPQCFEPKYYLYRHDIWGTVEIQHGQTPSKYRPEDDTIFLIHGWRSSATATWVLEAKDAFLSQDNYNIIAVDWSSQAKNLYYPQSASDIRVTAVDVAMMVGQLKPSFSWCVGESLGAHTCGLAGKHGANWDKITGLDPAGPMFERGSCSRYPKDCRLHPSHAKLVEAIHTDAEETLDSYGTKEPLGHCDFYPNGGDRQPACAKIGLDTGCNHLISALYFVESIATNCFVTKQRCTDPKNIPGSCIGCRDGECPNMGRSSQGNEGIFYLQTNAAYPYCL